METLRLGEAMLRSSQPLLPFLAPSLYRNSHARRSAVVAISSVARSHQSRQLQCQASRTFSTSQCRGQEKRPNAASSAREFPSIAPSSGDMVEDDMGSILDSALDNTKNTLGTSASRTSRFSSPNAQARNRAPTGLGKYFGLDRPTDGSSVDDVLSLFGPGSQPRSGRSSYEDIGALIDPKGTTTRKSTRSTTDEEIQIPMKLGPTAGRTVHIDPKRNIDLGRAFQALDGILIRNSVKTDFFKQRFHERPGLKRKRLKSLRWRKRFKTGFKAILKKVHKMRKQGW